jgi:single-stranded-DNA-specific exonuclease RecJ
MLADTNSSKSASKPGIISGGTESIAITDAINIYCISPSSSEAFVTLSISGKEWRYPPEYQVDAALVNSAQASPLLAKLLIRRGVATAQAAEQFLNPASYKPTSPMELLGMQKAIDRINQAIHAQEQITVYGDYDVDGVTGTSVLLTVLRALGAKVDYYIPNRTGEGYGLNLKAVSILASKHKTRLIITCDCGVSNFAEINFAKSLGVDTIVADHHTMPEMLPPAVAILHPKQLNEEHPLFHLPGVGVAYKLCEELLDTHGLKEDADKLLDLVTLGMIADMVPLVKENRYLVQIGLPKLVASPRAGIQALLGQVRAQSGTDVVGFGLAPRINAVGRLADANLAVDLMTTEDMETAEKLAKQLELENARRQDLCEKIFVEADQMVASKKINGRGIAIYKKDWHHGVVGIVASRLVEKYHLPVFIGELDENEGIVKGSARGIEGIDLYQVLKANEHLLTRWGGHKMAAGFSLEADKADAFCQGIVDTCSRFLEGARQAPYLDIDQVLEPKDVDFALIHLLNNIAPFGMANKKPIIVMKGLTCTGTKVLGKEGKHHRIMLSDSASGFTFESVMWNSKDKVPTDYSEIDVAFMPEINSFNGKDRLQLVLNDWRYANAGAGDGAKDIKHSQAIKADTTVLANATNPAANNPIEKSPAQATVNSAAESVAGKTPNKAPASIAPVAGTAGNTTVATAAERVIASAKLNWKDLRTHQSPQGILETAQRKLGQKLFLFAEAIAKQEGMVFCDRTALAEVGAKEHLLIWQHPPTLQVLQDLVHRTGAKEIYLVGAAKHEDCDSNAFLRKLMGLVRYAVNQKEGKVPGEKMAAALATSKKSIALGLTLLNKIGVIDWYAEDGFIYLDLFGEPEAKAEDQSEFQRLSQALKEVSEFRSWLTATPLNEIQLAIAPNQIKLAQKMPRRDDELTEPDQYQGQQIEPVSGYSQ